MPIPRLDSSTILRAALTGTALAAGSAAVRLYLEARRRPRPRRRAAMGDAIARVLHQIKNPLQTILLHAELLQDERTAADPRTRGEICDAIAGEALRLNALLEELSVYASGDSRSLALEPLPLHELLRELADREALRPSARVDASRIEEAVVRADAYYLRQALENLIANARDAMAGRPHPHLTLRLAREGERVAIVVGDNGVGIPAEALEGIFQPFVSGKSKGMGLGLPICREIVEGHGGRIEVESRPGVGTEFRVILPAGDAAPN